jgi:hypothetical protein
MSTRRGKMSEPVTVYCRWPDKLSRELSWQA